MRGSFARRAGGSAIVALLFLSLVTVAGDGRPAQAQTPSNPIEAENALPGTPGWEIDDANLPQSWEIAGYIPQPSVLAGDDVVVHVNRTGVDAGQPYTVEVFRLGYYGGVGARRTYGPSIHTDGGNDLPPAEVTVDETGLLEADYPVGVSFPTATGGTPWTTGSYVVRLTAASGTQVFVPLTVRSQTPADFYFLQSHLTWQAYNQVMNGGNSLYAWNTRYKKTRYCALNWFGTCLFWSGVFTADSLPHLPKYTTAAQVSFHRPYPGRMRQSDGAGEIFPYEYPLIQWMEKEGYDVSYAADFDLEQPVPSGTRAIVLPAHSEYWTQAMRDNAEAAQADGIGLVSFGANQAYWRGRIEGATAGDAGVYTLYKQNNGQIRDDDPLKNDPDLATGLFRSLGQPEQLLLGSQFRSYLYMSAAPGAVGTTSHGWLGLGPAQDVNHALFVGTGIQANDKFTALMGGEFDQIMPQYASLPNVEKLFSTFVHQNFYPSGIDFWGGLFCSWGISSSCRHTFQHSVVVEKVATDGVTVSRTFNAGTFNWMWGLATFELYDGVHDFESPKMQALTTNILRWSAKLDG